MFLTNNSCLTETISDSIVNTTMYLYLCLFHMNHQMSNVMAFSKSPLLHYRLNGIFHHLQTKYLMFHIFLHIGEIHLSTTFCKHVVLCSDIDKMCKSTKNVYNNCKPKQIPGFHHPTIQIH